jgi:hypothetical protein
MPEPKKFIDYIKPMINDCLEDYDKKSKNLLEYVSQIMQDNRIGLENYLLKIAQENPLLIADDSKLDELVSLLGGIEMLILNPNSKDIFMCKVDDIYSGQKNEAPGPCKGVKKYTKNQVIGALQSLTFENSDGASVDEIRKRMGLSKKMNGRITGLLNRCKKRGILKEYVFMENRYYQKGFEPNTKKNDPSEPDYLYPINKNTEYLEASGIIDSLYSAGRYQIKGNDSPNAHKKSIKKFIRAAGYHHEAHIQFSNDNIILDSSTHEIFKKIVDKKVKQK